MKKIFKENKFFVQFYVCLMGIKHYIVYDYIINVPFYFLRLQIVKLNVDKIGSNCSIFRNIEIINGENIQIGNNCVINKKVILDGRGGKLVIGNNVDIAQETNIWTLEHDVNDDYHASRGDNVVIEDYVWIASRVTILPGVTIGRGAVVACNSVVTKNIPPMQIFGGIPAKKIGDRTSKLNYSLIHRPWFA